MLYHVILVHVAFVSLCQAYLHPWMQENEPFSTDIAFATILEDLNHTGPLVPGGLTLQGDPEGAPLFASITPQPVAAASLGQVYKATTLDGRTVAVKAQKTQISLIIRVEQHGGVFSGNPTFESNKNLHLPKFPNICRCNDPAA